MVVEIVQKMGQTFMSFKGCQNDNTPTFMFELEVMNQLELQYSTKISIQICEILSKFVSP